MTTWRTPCPGLAWDGGFDSPTRQAGLGEFNSQAGCDGFDPPHWA
jgi:hypothetical protein